MDIGKQKDNPLVTHAQLNVKHVKMMINAHIVNPHTIQMEINVLKFALELNGEMMLPENVNHVLNIVIVVLEHLEMNVPVVPLNGSYMTILVSNHAQTTIMEMTENVNTVTIGVKLVQDPTMETHVLVETLTILMQMV